MENWRKLSLNYCQILSLSVPLCRTGRTASSEFGTYRLCEQRRFRRACASAQSHQNLRCSLIQAVNQEEPSDRKPDPWPLWMAGHAQLKFVMTECSKTQIRLTRPSWCLGFTLLVTVLLEPVWLRSSNLSHLMTKPTKWSLHPAKTGIRRDLSESSRCAQWVA